MSYAGKNQNIDKHGLRQQSYKAEVAVFEFGTGPLAPLPMKAKKGRQAAVGLPVWLAFESYISKGREERIIVTEDNKDLARVEVEELGTSDSKSGQMSISPWVEFPLPEEAWLAIGGSFYAKYPEFEEGDRTGTRSGYLSVAGTAPKFTYSATAKYEEAFDTETKPVIMTTSASGSMGFTLTDTVSLSWGPVPQKL